MLPDDIRTQFLSHLRFELGLSENTCEAYLSDVDKLLSYMDVEGLSIEAIDYPRLQHFIATLHDLASARRRSRASSRVSAPSGAISSLRAM